jgi:hypothetical protein
MPQARVGALSFHLPIPGTSASVPGAPRFGEPREVWLALRFILECGFFTGRVIEVDGGAQM